MLRALLVLVTPLMMSAPWQTAVVLVCVAASLVYLARRLFRAIISPSSSGCGNCSQPPVTGIKQKPLVTLDALSQSATRQSKPSSRDTDG